MGTIANGAAATRDAAEAQRLAAALTAARERTLMLASDLTGEQLIGPKLAIVNPPLWELGHLGWFQEHWCLRQRAGGQLAPSFIANADQLYDSAAVAHDTRWDLPLPDLDATLKYLTRVLQSVLERLQREPDDSALLYFAELAAAHEEMHCEAFTYTRQTLGYAPPKNAVIARNTVTLNRNTSGQAPQPRGPRERPSGDAEIPGGHFMLGADRASGFVFDNEKWAHPVEVQPFGIARTAVTNAEFAAFVDDGGYTREELWSEEGWRWRARTGATQPVYWRKEGAGWCERRYDTLEPLRADAPVVHVNWYEAQAYCRWAKRRLPTEAEWEYAATISNDRRTKRAFPWGDAPPSADRANFYGAADGPVDVAALPGGDSAWGCRQMMGNVWEWTADTFAAYPGFVRDPYKEYSEPWFGTHKVLRGGAFATRAWLMRATWRNFFTPDRRDIYAGFRTCAA